MDIHSLLQDSLEKVIAGHSTVEEMLKLIELENDDKLAGELDLKKALEFSEIANEAEHHEGATSQVTEVTGDALATTFETETPESAVPIAPAQVEPTPVAEPVSAPVQTPEVTSTPVAPATPVVTEVVTPQAPVMPAEANVTLEQPVINPVEVPTVNPTVVPTVNPAENPNAGIPEIVS